MPHPRGSAPATKRPSTRDEGWTGYGRGLTSPRLWKTVAASVLAHLVLTPVPALLGLLTFLPADPFASDLPPEEALTAIPIDLMVTEVPAAAPLAPEPPAEPVSPADLPPQEEAEQAAVLIPEPEEAPEPEPEAKSAPVEPEPPEDEAEAEPEAEKDEEKAQGIGDPVALAGDAGALADSNAGVRILVHTAVIRGHQLGPEIGRLLRRTPQWSDFLGPSGINPIRDVDRLLIAGPELSDTRNMVAVVEHSMPESAIDRALGQLVEQDGEWLDRSSRLAKALVDRAERLLRAPGEGIVVVAPLSAEESVRSMPSNLSFPSGPEGVAVQVHMDQPWKPLRRLRFNLPKSIEWARADVRANASGGAEIRLLAQDEDPALAKEHAQKIQDLLVAATHIDLRKKLGSGMLGRLGRSLLGDEKKLVESIDLHSEGEQIIGRIVVTKHQLQDALAYLGGLLPPERYADARPPQEALTEKVGGQTDATSEGPSAPGAEVGAPADDQAPSGSERKAHDAQSDEEVPPSSEPAPEVPAPEGPDEAPSADSAAPTPKAPDSEESPAPAGR